MSKYIENMSNYKKKNYRMFRLLVINKIINFRRKLYSYKLKYTFY